MTDDRRQTIGDEQEVNQLTGKIVNRMIVALRYHKENHLPSINTIYRPSSIVHLSNS